VQLNKFLKVYSSKGFITFSFMLLPAIFILFFAFHQARLSGFFTSEFGYLEIVAIYLPLILSFGAINSHIYFRQYYRGLFILFNTSFALGAAWLLIVFPFNFQHVAEILPGFTKLFVSWISPATGRILLVLVMVRGLILLLFFVPDNKCQHRD
jgi:hypothetical protein